MKEAVRGYSVYVRKMDGSPSVRLGEGDASGLSPDGKWAVAITARSEPAQITLLPTGAGERRTVTHDQINHQRAFFFPDGKRILFAGNEPGPDGARLYVQDLVGGKPEAITPEGIRLSRSKPISPDGNSVIARGADGKVYLYSISRGVAPGPRSRGGLPSGARTANLSLSTAAAKCLRGCFAWIWRRERGSSGRSCSLGMRRGWRKSPTFG